MEYCTGACLFGTCPFERCIRENQVAREAVKLNANMRILETGVMQDINIDGCEGYGLAVDIGTTTIVAALYNLKTGDRVETASCLNSQSTLGPDVISRIKFAREQEDGLGSLRRAVLRDIKDLISKVAEGIDIVRCVVTGNTTMLHIFADLAPDSMGVSPFTPLSLFGNEIDGDVLGIECKIKLVKCISSFVGGDITSAILAAGMMNSDETSLLLDIGTNGEVALMHNGKLLTTSTAAGPAFEGATITCGMAGVNGAINKVTLQGKLHLSTIGDVKAKGICGSGLLDLTALLLETQMLEDTGAFSDSPAVEDNQFNITDSVYITQGDIRELQAAKAAIAAGVITLMHVANVSYDEVKKVYLAGGFGNFLDPKSAAKIGIFPQEALDKIIPIGNAALSGATLALLSDTHFEKSTDIADIAEHVELGNNPFFTDTYIDCMMFE